jgi:Acetyltransferase (GNAT) domain
VTYSAAFCFLGLYICQPERRSSGYGLQVWQQAMVRAAQRTIGLDGVVAQQDNYKRSGFSLSHRNIRFVGKARIATFNSRRIRCATAQDISSVTDYDETVFSFRRQEFLQVWLNGHGGRTVYIAMEDKTVHGYAVIRACLEGYKIGPLFADTPGMAEDLFLSAMASVAGEKLVVDVPDANTQAMSLMEKHGFQKQFETARMYRRILPFLPLHKMFGITTLELG